MGKKKEPSTYTSSNSTQLCAIKNKMKYWVNGVQSRTLRTLIFKKGKNIKGTLNSNYVVKTNKESTTEEQILFMNKSKSTCLSESRYYIAQAALEHLILSHLWVLEIQACTTTEFTECWESNPGLHAYQASILQTNLNSQPAMYSIKQKCRQYNKELTGDQELLQPSVIP